MNESEYFQGVVDCCKLLFRERSGLSEYSPQNILSISEELYIHLEKIELELENRVPRISPLYSALKIDKEAVKSQSDYWEGIRDTTNLIRNFINYKNNSFSLKEYEDFLQKILVKSSQKLKIETSPLVNKLDISFTTDVSNKPVIENNSHKISSNDINSEELRFNRSEGLELFSDDFSEEYEIKENSDTEGVIQQKEKIEEDSEEMIELALEELNRDNTISNLRSGLLSQINNEISRIDTPVEDILPEKEKTVPIVQITPKDANEDDKEPKLHSSPLKDALKMLKTDEEEDLDY